MSGPAYFGERNEAIYVHGLTPPLFSSPPLFSHGACRLSRRSPCLSHIARCVSLLTCTNNQSKPRTPLYKTSMSTNFFCTYHLPNLLCIGSVISCVYSSLSLTITVMIVTPVSPVYRSSSCSSVIELLFCSFFGQLCPS